MTEKTESTIRYQTMRKKHMGTQPVIEVEVTGIVREATELAPKMMEDEVNCAKALEATIISVMVEVDNTICRGRREENNERLVSNMEHQNLRSCDSDSIPD